MIIVHFSQDFRKGKPQLGGYSRILNQTLDGNEHIIFTIGLEYLEFEVVNERSQNIRVFQIPLKSLNCYSLYQQIFKLPIISLKLLFLMKKLKITPDIFIGHAQLFNYYVLQIVAKMIRSKLKVVWEFNVVWGFDIHLGIKNKLRSYVQKKSQGIILKTANGLIFQTVSSRDFIFEKYEIANVRNVVIKNAVTPTVLGGKILTQDSPILVYGLFDKLNGIQFLIDSLSNSELNCNISIHFLGDGPLLSKVLEFCEKNNNHKYLGNKTKTETIEIIRSYNFGIIPRINTLGSNLYIPTKIVEMLNAGIIVLVSDVKGLTEVVKHKKNGFIFKEGDRLDFADKLISMINLNVDEINRIRYFSEDTIFSEFNLNDQIRNQRFFFERL